MAGVSRVTEDTWGSENYGLPCALYFYYLNDQLPEWSADESSAILGNCPAIQSIQYVPFLKPMDMEINSVEYDSVRFGSLEEIRPSLQTTPLVYRIKSLLTETKTLGTFACYTPSKTIGGDTNWRNESRLYNYPYSFGMLTDNLNTPIEIQYHLCTSNTNTIKVKSTISDRCSYGIFVEGYKGDTNGKMESMVSGDAHELPCSSSAYGQWYASNKNQVKQNVQNMASDSFIQNASLQKQNMADMVGQASGLSLNPLSIIGVGANMYNSALQNNLAQTMNTKGVQNAIQMNMSTTRDLKSTPSTMLSMGSDVYYGLANGDKKVNLYRFGLTENYYNRLGYYFTLFGYKQSKVMQVNTRNRNYFNYIKTIGVNLKALEGIPRNYLEELKSIYDNGVTIWHIDRPNFNSVGDYSKDNYEV